MIRSLLFYGSKWCLAPPAPAFGDRRPPAPSATSFPEDIKVLATLRHVGVVFSVRIGLCGSLLSLSLFLGTTRLGRAGYAGDVHLCRDLYGGLFIILF
jgi:hypothetical protein